MNGSPLHIGMIVPSSNIAFETELARLSIPASTAVFHMTRLKVTSISLQAGDTDQFALGPILDAASLLADARVNGCVWAGTAGSWLGLEHDLAISAALTKKTGIPATTSTLALMAACQFLNVNRIILVTPYLANVVNQICTIYSLQGMEVIAERHLDISDNYQFGLVSKETIVSLICEANTLGADGVVVACTNLHGASSAPQLRSRLGIPVIDSVAATIWHSIEMLNPGYGGTPEFPSQLM